MEEDVIKNIGDIVMTDDVIYELTKLYLKEIGKEDDKFVMTKKELIKFCLKMMKVVKQAEVG